MTIDPIIVSKKPSKKTREELEMTLDHLLERIIFFTKHPENYLIREGLEQQYATHVRCYGTKAPVELYARRLKEFVHLVYGKEKL